MPNTSDDAHVSPPCLHAGRPKFSAFFDLATLGHRHAHLAGAPPQKLAEAVKPEGLLVMETASMLVQLRQEQVRPERKGASIAHVMPYQQLPCINSTEAVPQ